LARASLLPQRAGAPRPPVLARRSRLGNAERATARSLAGVMDLRAFPGRREMFLFLGQRGEPLRALGARFCEALLRLQRRLVALTLDRIAVLQVDAFELGRLAEELMAARFHHRDKLLAKATRVAIRGQRRIHVVAEGLLAHTA